MTKTELIEKINERTGVSTGSTSKVVNEAINIIYEEIEAGGSLNIIGLGTLDTTVRKSRKGKNPSTGEEMTIPEKRVPRFKAGRVLKEKAAGN